MFDNIDFLPWSSLYLTFEHILCLLYNNQFAELMNPPNVDRVVGWSNKQGRELESSGGQQEHCAPPYW